MNNFKTILSFAKPYLKFGVLNIIFNIFYAIFNVFSVLAFIPVLQILFETTEKTDFKEPVYEGISNLGSFLEDNFYYFISQKIENEGAINVLLFVCILTLSLFFFKNFFRYLASYVLSFMRNGWLKD